MNAAPHNQRAALVLLSADRDYSTCPAWAPERITHIETVALNCRQRPRIELDQRLVVLDDIGWWLPRWVDRVLAAHDERARSSTMGWAP